MVFPCTDLRKQKGQEKSARHPQPDEIAEAEGLGDEITGRFAQRRGNDLDDPEGERDFGDLVQGVGVGRWLSQFLPLQGRNQSERIARPAPTLVFFERIQFMYQPWLTTRDWPVRALEGKAAKRWATSATSSIVVKA